MRNRSRQKSHADRIDRTLRVDELERQYSGREEEEESKMDRSSIIEEETEQATIAQDSEILVEGEREEDAPPQESETTLNIYDDEVQFAVSGSKLSYEREGSKRLRVAQKAEESLAGTSVKGKGERRLPRWDDTNADTYSALKSLIHERAKSEIEMDRIKANKDILFVHKQDAIRMASRFKNTINTLLDGQKDRFGEECDSQLREKCKSPNSSTNSCLQGKSVAALYSSTLTGNSSAKAVFDSKKYSTIGDYKRHERSNHSAAPTVSASRYSSVEKEE